MTQDHRDWFERTMGEWRSERRYTYFGPGQKVKAQTLITTFFEIGWTSEPEMKIAWDSYMNRDFKNTLPEQPTTHGEMLLTLDGDKLLRNKGYFTDNETHQQIERIDQDALELFTSYDGCTYREEIRLLDNDCLRLRQTVGFDDHTGELILSGQYTEVRL